MMDVRGVLRSWLTLVISSVFSRSLLSCFSTASRAPWPMLFRLWACFLSSGNRNFSGTGAMSPAAMRRAPS